MAALFKTCSIDGCNMPRYCRGWCINHYNRWRSHGDPLAGGTSRGEPLKWLLDVALRCTGDECLQWPFGKFPNGYGSVKNHGRAVPVHRLVCLLAHGEPPTPLHQAAHSCGQGATICCVNPRHLRWATVTENQHDKLIHGTLVRGERNVKSRLTEADVREIRKLRGVMTQRAMAKQFRVAPATIAMIHTRRNWGWLR